MDAFPQKTRRTHRGFAARSGPSTFHLDRCRLVWDAVRPASERVSVNRNRFDAMRSESVGGRWARRRKPEGTADWLKSSRASLASQRETSPRVRRRDDEEEE